ncbi:MAG: hypothetical protein HDR71_17195 [Lachnospiraceae bacterium]|nr:hypothetical protein [Lachnospiraceae bacterium]MBD5395949.1 hypothetical protein [Lachnospiraceae bacterium]
MDIKKQRIALLLISIVAFIVYLNFSSLRSLLSNKIMSVKVMSEEELADMIVDQEVPEESEIRFDSHPVAFDASSNTFFIPQSLTEEHWEGRLTAERGKLYFLDDEYFRDKSLAIEEGHIFKLYQVDEEKQSEYNVIFTGMPVICLAEESSALEDDETVSYGTVFIFDQYHSAARFQSTDCTFHVRGGTSYGYVKKSYKLELANKNMSLLGMRKDDDWILNALYDDAGLIHNKLSVQVWQEIASSNHVMNDEGYAMEYAELFLNNEYCGVYALTERVDKQELSLGKKDILYKCRTTRIPEEHNYTNEDTDGMQPIFVLKYPKDLKEEDWDPIKKWVDLFLKGEIDTYEEGADFLNMENAVDANLFCMLMAGTDNTRKNNYFISEYQQDGTYRMKKIPWDMNATWGNPWVDIEECNFTKYDPDCYKDVSIWISDINTLYYYDRETVSELLRDRWNELRGQGIITKEKIFEMLDRQFRYLHASGAYERNYERWPNGTEYWSDNYIYEYVDQRIDFLDQYYEQLYEDCRSPKVYGDVDYSAEFDTRYYWEANKEVLQELYPYDTQMLLEHYALYGKPFDLKAIYDGGEIPGAIIE